MIYAATGFFVLGSGFMTWKVMRLWRNPALVDFFMNAFTFLPFGPAVRRGEVRSLGITVVSVWAIAGLVLLALWDKAPDPATTVLGLVAVLVIMGCLATEVCVILFNRPKFVVPPHMRSEPGVLTARRTKRTRMKR